MLNPKECEQRKGNRIVAKALFSCSDVMAKCPKCSKGMHACALSHSLTDMYTCARRGLLRWYCACFMFTSDLVFILGFPLQRRCFQTTAANSRHAYKCIYDDKLQVIALGKDWHKVCLKCGKEIIFLLRSVHSCLQTHAHRRVQQDPSPWKLQ